MGRRYVSWNKENYKSFGMVLKSSLKWAHAAVSSFSSSGLDFILIGMMVVNFLNGGFIQAVFLQTYFNFHINLSWLFILTDPLFHLKIM